MRFKGSHKENRKPAKTKTQKKKVPRYFERMEHISYQIRSDASNRRSLFNQS